MRAVDMSSPHQWYSVARAIQRRIIYHTGPTNSGKTYEALQVRLSHGPLQCGWFSCWAALPAGTAACGLT